MLLPRISVQPDLLAGGSLSTGGPGIPVWLGVVSWTMG